MTSSVIGKGRHRQRNTVSDLLNGMHTKLRFKTFGGLVPPGVYTVGKRRRRLVFGGGCKRFKQDCIRK